MTKLFLIPRQKVNLVETWKQVCPNCKSIEELGKTTEYDLTMGDRGYTYGFDYSNANPISENNICQNCGWIFKINE